MADSTPSRRSARRRAFGLTAAAAAAAVAAPRLGKWAGSKWGSAARENMPLLLIPLAWVVIARLERLHPFRQEWNRDHEGDTRLDATHMATSWILGGQAGMIAGNLFGSALRRRLPRSLTSWWPRRLPLPARLAGTLVIFEFGHYWWHRLAHETPALWRFHSVHHSPERLYWLNAARFHPLDLFPDAFIETTVLTAIGVDAETRVAHGVFRGIYGQIQHRNVDLDSRSLNTFFATEELHRWHHSDDPAQGNTNYGAVSSVWDRVFGTLYAPDRALDANLGNGDPDFPDVWSGQITFPVRAAAN